MWQASVARARSRPPPSPHTSPCTEGPAWVWFCAGPREAPLTEPGSFDVGCQVPPALRAEQASPRGLFLGWGLAGLEESPLTCCPGRPLSWEGRVPLGTELKVTGFLHSASPEACPAKCT